MSSLAFENGMNLQQVYLSFQQISQSLHLKISCFTIGCTILTEIMFHIMAPPPNSVEQPRAVPLFPIPERRFRRCYVRGLEPYPRKRSIPTLRARRWMITQGNNSTCFTSSGTAQQVMSTSIYKESPLVRLNNHSRWYYAAMSQCLKSEIEQRSNVGRGQRTLRISVDLFLSRKCRDSKCSR